MRIFRIILEYLAAFLIIFLLLFLIASAVVIKYYADDVEEYTMELINKQLDTKISVGEIGISLIKKFPNTSVYLNNVTIWSGHNFNRREFSDISTDTLAVIDKLYLQFNILELLKKNYKIKSLEARGGELRILIDSKGAANFEVEKKEKNETVSSLIQVKGFIIRDIEVVYKNLAKDIETQGLVEDMYIEGNFAKQNYALKVGADVFIDRLYNNEIEYLYKKEIRSDISLRVVGNLFTIDKGDVFIEELRAGIQGELIANKGEGLSLDLNLKGENIDIQWIAGILASRNQALSGMDGKGLIDLSIKIKGIFSATINPHIEAGFSVQNGYLGIEKIPIELKSISLNGKFTNGPSNSIQTSSVNIETFYTKFGNSSLQGSLLLENLINQKFNILVYGNIEATDLDDYLPDLPLNFLSGTIKPHLTISGSFSRNKDLSKAILFSPKGTIDISNLSLSMTHSSIPFHSINGKLEIAPNMIEANLNGFISETDFLFKGFIGDPFQFNRKKSVYSIKGELYSSNLDLDKVLANFQSAEDEEKTLLFPENISLDIGFKFDKLSKGDIKSRRVTGNLIYRYPQLFLQPFNLETLNGYIISSAVIADLNMPVHALSINSQFENVDIHDLFKSFNDFGQDFISYNNMNGNISGNTEFFCRLNSDFSIRTSDIVSKTDFIIKNGELNNFIPIIKLSDFLKIDKMDHVVFSTLKNTIIIRDNLITIPQMDINSSAINIQASGTHGFDNKYEYHLAAKLSEILFDKAKKSRNKEFDIAIDKEDKRTIFLVIYDKGEGMLIEFDEDQALIKIRQDLKSEKTELKVILNKELGLFKKDEDIIKDAPPEEQPVLRFEFPEETETDSFKSTKDVKQKWWKRKVEEDKKPEFDFVLDDSIL